VPRFFITTPIYYVNAAPHLGTFYTTVVSDALARFHRAVDRRDGNPEGTFFVTGLDEHGQKIERLARDQGMDPQAYCDGIAEKFVAMWTRAEISYDDFIRTTSPRHAKAVGEMWRRMLAAGDLYPGEYDGLYCVGCEEWKSEDDVVVVNGEKVCPIHRRPVERVKEKNYFFRLTRYADRLLELYDRPGFVEPEGRRNEVAEFVRGGLRDISVSRQSVKWGIPVPGDAAHTIYVWLDALTNYLTVLGGPDAVAAGGRAGALWAGSHHIIAKDILRFHAVYWPAMLMSAGLPVPAKVFCHGYLTVKGQKISKSIPATRVDPHRIADVLGMDPLRYFVLREYTFGGDGDFTYEALLQRYESDLGNDLGNLLNRTISMVHRYIPGGALAARAPTPAESSEEVVVLGRGAGRVAGEHWRDFAPSSAIESAWKLVRAANRYVDARKPWELARVPANLEPEGALSGVLANCCEALRIVARLVAPAMPEVARRILGQLGRPLEEAEAWPVDDAFGWPGATVGPATPLFPRFEPAVKADLLERWMPSSPAEPETGTIEADGAGDPRPAAASAASSSAAAATTTAPPTSSHAPASSTTPSTSSMAPTQASPAETAAPTIDKADFDRAELRAARVLACERVPKTEKLLKLTLDLGTEQRTVVSGIAGVYPPETLIGRTVVYLANLKPAKIRGVVSQGMILAAGDAEVLALVTLDRDVPPGSPIR
jgi:methionyl-tRNA synthetase